MLGLFSLPTNGSAQTTTTTAVAAVATTTLVAVASALWQRKSTKQVALKKYKKECKTIQLLPFESSYMCKSLDGISTITFFEAESKEEMEEALSFFQDRALAIEKANPWLLGFLHVDDDNETDGNLALFVPPKETSSSRSSFSVFRPQKAIPDEYHSMVEALRPTMVGDTFAHMASLSLEDDNKNNNTPSWEPLWKVTFIPDFDGDDETKENKTTVRFGLVVSGNHCLVDGHGYYKLFNMFSSVDEPIAALSPVRNHDLDSSIEAIFAEPPMHLSPPPGFILNMVASRLRNLVLPTPTKSIGFVVSSDWIRNQKEAHQESIAAAQNSTSGAATVSPPSFVSTNDVLVSEFSKATDCDLMHMAINLRGRVEDCTDDLLGNHEGGLSYTQKDFESPGFIRQSIAGPVLQRITKDKNPLPTNWEHLLECTNAFSTSWTTFAKPIQVTTKKGTTIQQSLHVPLYDFPKVFPACFCSMMVTFRPRQGETAVLCSGTTELMQKLVTSKMVGSILYAP